jgi:hypothetical protein
MRFSHSLWTGFIALLSIVASAASAEDKKADFQPASGLGISGVLPVVVTLPSNPTSPESVRPNFDDFSWRSFIALNWPADPQHPGAPISPNDPGAFLKAGSSYTSVWSTYREGYELFPAEGEPPPFGEPTPTTTVCGEARAGAKVLLMASKAGTLLGDVDQAFSYPLVDQNNNYIYYEIRFNRSQYEFVREHKLYLAKYLMQSEQRAPIDMPISAEEPYREGAVMLKAAWRQLTPKDDASRYFTTRATILDQSSGKNVCRDVTVGLIGFHIGHKVSRMPQWVWSSFEQVDNVPDDDGRPPARALTLNNGTNTPATTGGWANRPNDKREVSADKRTPAQVVRLNPIPTTPAGKSTVSINDAYRALLANTVWRNYELVITQWPAAPVAQADFKPKESQGVYPKDAGAPFPLHDAVNTAMETWFQSRSDAAGAGGNSCMECHYGAGIADFSWSLVLRSR